MSRAKTGKTALAKCAPKERTPADYNQTDAVTVAARDGEQRAAAVARKLTEPEVGAAAVIGQWQRDMHDVNELISEMSRQVEAVNSGDLRRAEGMLVSQAHSLDAIFVNLARRATGQQHLAQWEVYLRMAMKAQSQCRMTLETLATIKNPTAVFARQANINNGGQQQVNNGAEAVSRPVRASAHARAEERSSVKNELLEVQHGQRLDTGAQGTAGGADPHLEAVE
jgi:hypothetical protein